jgi:hypothetical protein
MRTGELFTRNATALLSMVPRQNHDQSAFLGNDLERKGRFAVEQLKELNNELAALTKQQADARMLEVYVRMTEQEIKAFDLRTQRISRIYIILSEHDAKR